MAVLLLPQEAPWIFLFKIKQASNKNFNFSPTYQQIGSSTLQVPFGLVFFIDKILILSAPQERICPLQLRKPAGLVRALPIAKSLIISVICFGKTKTRKMALPHRHPHPRPVSSHRNRKVQIISPGECEEFLTFYGEGMLAHPVLFKVAFHFLDLPFCAEHDDTHSFFNNYFIGRIV